MKNNFREMLLSKASKIIVEQIARSVIDSPSLFNDLYELTYDKEKKVSWRAMWACNKLCEKHSYLFDDKYEELSERAMKETDGGIRRLMLNVVYHLDQPKELNVAFMDFCIDNMTSLNNPPSGQAICMKLAYKMCRENQPELLNEILAYIENIETEYYNPAVICTRNTILKEINKKQK